MIIDDLTGLEEVSLYQREFLGIDKECNENYALTKDSFDKFHDSEESIKTLLIVEGFFYGLSGLGVFVVFSAIFYQKKDSLV